MALRRFLLAVAGAAAFFVSPPASAQTAPVAKSYRNAAGQLQDGLGVTIIGPIAATSAVTNGSIATASTFQSALPANPDRLGCAIYNNHASAALLIFLGAPGSATVARSIPVPSGGAFNCGSFQGLVLTDQISITSTTAGATYVVVSQ